MSLVKPDVGSRVEMFVVRPEGFPIIYDIPQERRTLEELGIRELTDVVIFDSELQPENSPNKTEFYHLIGKKFNIAKEEYASLLPKVAPGTHADGGTFFDKPSTLPINSGNFNSKSTAQPSNSNIPPEYANDPDLWFAIQASLGNEAPMEAPRNNGNEVWQDDIMDEVGDVN